MKQKYTLGLLAMAMSATVMAQEVDDMYFNSKDRVVANASREVALTKRYQQEDVAAVRNRPVNPSDSYSGRGVNPEYNAQGKNGTAVIQNNPDYFVSNFQPKAVNQNLYNGAGSYSNCNCASNPYYGMGGYSGYGNPYGMYSPYGMSPYGMSPYSSMYSPYGSMYSPYGSMYSPYGSMYSPYGMSPYGMSGMSMMMGYGSGFGMSGLYGALGYGYSSMVPTGYVPSGYTTGATGYDSRATVQGRRGSRSSSLNNYVDNTRADATGTAIVGTNGRVRDGSRSSQPDYYDRSWRNNPDNLTRSGWSNPNGNTGSNSWGGSNTNSWDNGSRGRSSYDAFGGSRSSMGGSSGSGFSGGSVGGGSSGGGGGHSRGRN